MAWVCYKDQSQGSYEDLMRLSWRTVYSSVLDALSENVFVWVSLSRQQVRPFPPPKGTGEFKEGLVYEEGKGGSIERNTKGKVSRQYHQGKQWPGGT